MTASRSNRSDAPNHDTSAADQPADRPPKRWMTVPNALCLLRLLVSPVLILLAMADQSYAFVMLFVALSVTDWVDGKIARMFVQQRSRIGPRLDSAADALMYAGLILGAILMRGDLMREEFIWLAVALGSYVATIAVGLIKLRSWPSYHTRLAKISWLLVAVAAIAALLDWFSWPLRVALVVVTIANLETLTISLLLQEPKTNVKSVVSVLRQKRSE